MVLLPLPTLERFTGTLIELLDIVKDLILKITKEGYQIDAKGSDLDIAILYMKSVSTKDLIEGFINKSRVHWGQIKNRDEKFFIENSKDIFSMAPVRLINSFTQLFTLVDRSGKKLVDAEDRDIIWEFFDTFVRQSIRYIHEQREPGLDTEGKECYRTKYFPEIKLKKLSDDWKVVLSFQPGDSTSIHCQEQCHDHSRPLEDGGTPCTEEGFSSPLGE